VVGSADVCVGVSTQEGSSREAEKERRESIKATKHTRTCVCVCVCVKTEQNVPEHDRYQTVDARGDVLFLKVIRHIGRERFADDHDC
jgi:hypothetical protein